MFLQDNPAELWSHGAVRCVLVPHGHAVEVELRNADDSPFLRKTAPNRQAALNEAEYLRLLLRRSPRRPPSVGLKPFALVIEDDHDNREAITEALRLFGVRVLGCRNGSEGVALAQELAPDLVVIDYRLPDMSGVDVCRCLRADPTTASIPIIAVTASPEAVRSDECEVDALLSKPCQIDTLIAAARLFIGRADSASDGGS